MRPQLVWCSQEIEASQYLVDVKATAKLLVAVRDWSYLSPCPKQHTLNIIFTFKNPFLMGFTKGIDNRKVCVHCGKGVEPMVVGYDCLTLDCGLRSIILYDISLSVMAKPKMNCCIEAIIVPCMALHWKVKALLDGAKRSPVWTRLALRFKQVLSNCGLKPSVVIQFDHYTLPIPC